MANYTFDKLEQYMKDKTRSMERVLFESLTDINTSITDTTPVDKGFAKGSWTTSINKMEAVTNTEPDRSGAASIARTKAEMNKFKLGDTVYHLSNLVYMPRLEYGYSKQAPSGMVRRAIDNFQQNLDEAIKNGQ
jgi:hypothetical protein